jgi:hypothetical protein
MFLKIREASSMLPYDGIIRTGSKGMSHFVGMPDKDPQRVVQGTGKTGQMQPGFSSQVEHERRVLLYCAMKLH